MSWNIRPIHREFGLRILAWHDRTLYASKKYTLWKCFPEISLERWSEVGYFNPVWWRSLSVTVKPTYRLCRDGFHGLVVLSSGHLIASVPGAIATLCPGENEFQISHRLIRGTRPLNLAVTADERVFWGEYFSNPERGEVYVYGSENQGKNWQIVYTFPRKTIRHIHNIVYDRWQNCLWVLTGDDNRECQIIRASLDWKTTEIVLSGNQQARSVALLPTENAIYFATDTPIDDNYIYRLDRRGKLERLMAIHSSSIYGCQVGENLFFSTAVEPSSGERKQNSYLYGSSDGDCWQILGEWTKDRWPMTLFQFGNLILPRGENNTNLLVTTAIALQDNDLQTTFWRVVHD